MMKTRSWLQMTVAGVLVAGSAAAVSSLTLESAQAAAVPFKCTSTKGAFTPTQARVSHLGGIQVITVGRNSDGSMGTPAISDQGKQQLAWYNGGARPGSGKGGVAMDAHTYPDGSALGNRLYDNLVPGDTVMLASADNKHRTCYRVTSRQQYADNRVPMKRVVNGAGKGQILSIVVCSGTRRGPGDWSERTVWTAKAVPVPVRHPKQAPKPAPKPAPQPQPSLLGGLLGNL